MAVKGKKKAAVVYTVEAQAEASQAQPAAPTA
jgi:hypothetical protein